MLSAIRDDRGRRLHTVRSIKAVAPTFAESGAVFSFSNCCWEILLSVFGQNIFYIPTGFFYKPFIFRTQIFYKK